MAANAAHLNKVKELRESRGLSQSELARRMGTTHSTISRIESGMRRLSPQYMQEIARVLGVEPADLISKASGTINRATLLPVVGEVAVSKWTVPPVAKRAAMKDVTDEVDTIPVILPTEYAALPGSAYMVTEAHCGDIAQEGGYVITVAFGGARKTPLNGDTILIRTTEGRLERHMVAVAEVGPSGAFVDLGEGPVAVGKENFPVGLVVATYREL